MKKEYEFLSELPLYRINLSILIKYELKGILRQLIFFFFIILILLA